MAISEEQAKEQMLKADYRRWKDYASQLLIGMPLLLGLTGVSLVSGSNPLYGVSATAGAIGIVSTILWHSKEVLWLSKKNKPIFLLISSVCFGIQVSFFLLAIWGLNTC